MQRHAPGPACKAAHAGKAAHARLAWPTMMRCWLQFEHVESIIIQSNRFGGAGPSASRKQKGLCCNTAVLPTCTSALMLCTHVKTVAALEGKCSNHMCMIAPVHASSNHVESKVLNNSLQAKTHVCNATSKNTGTQSCNAACTQDLNCISTAQMRSADCTRGPEPWWRLSMQQLCQNT
jgi:hypothetical protein